jgi:hypothetical protein
MASVFPSLVRNWKRSNFSEKIQISSLVIGLLISCATAAFILSQAWDTHTLANQAVVQSTVAKDTFALAFRPALAFEVPTYTQTMPEDEVAAIFRNSGAGSATNVTERYSVLISGKIYKESGEKGIPELGAGMESEPLVVSLDRSMSSRILMPTITPKPDVLKVVARLSYDGAPGGRSGVCQAFVYDPMQRRFDPTAPC